MTCRGERRSSRGVVKVGVKGARRGGVSAPPASWSHALVATGVIGHHNVAQREASNRAI